jgi:2'-5' RNA ligase
MKLQDLFEKAAQGTYAGVYFSEQTKDAIEKYIKDNKIPNGVPRDKLHTTLLYSRKYLPNFKPRGQFAKPLEAEPLEFDVWQSTGDAPSRCLVLKISCPQLVDRHNHLMDKHKATYDFPEYIPHITLSYDIGDMEVDDFTDVKAAIPSVDIVQEYRETLDLDWAKKHA